VRGGKIIARSARDGETVVTLDGVERRLPEGTPVIADGERLVGVAGIFGGLEAGVADDTVDIFLESPNFVGARIRRASIALGLRTEGATRHERGLPLELAEVGRRRAAWLLIRAGARASAVSEAGEKPGTPRTVIVRAARCNALLGTDYAPARMIEALHAIGIRVEGGEELRAVVPWWRPDVVEEVDLIEEVARSIGYDGIPERRAVAAPQTVDESLYLQEGMLAGAAAAIGYTEVVSIALQGSRAVAAWERSGLPYWSDLATVVNPLSDDQRFLRPSLLPGLLAAAAKAWPRAGGSLRLFESGHIFRALAQGEQAPVSHSGMYADNGVIEWPSLAGLACFPSEDEAGTIDRRLLSVKADVEWLVRRLASKPVATVPSGRFYLHPHAAADLQIDGGTVAKFGRVHPRLSHAYDLPQTTYTFALYMEALPPSPTPAVFAALPRYPGTRRDIAVIVDERVTAGELMDAVRAARLDAFEDVAAFDEYVGPQVGRGKKSVALAIRFRRPDATITDAEADAAVAAAVVGLQTAFGAVLRGPSAT
jgi:phenylalanyl-tRNA synthetase beta chain